MLSGSCGLVLVTLIWGINSIAVKDALSNFLPLQFNLIRLTVATAILFAVLALSGPIRLPQRKDWALLVLAGFLGNTFYQYMFIRGLSLSTAGNTSFVLATMPATTALLSHFTGRQQMTARMWVGVALTVLGVSVIAASGPGASGLSSGPLAGDIVTLTGTLGWCLCTIIASDLMGRMSPLEFTAWTMLPGAVLMIPLAWREMVLGPWSRITTLNWAELLFSASFALVFSYIIWNKAIKDSGPAKTAVFGNLTPVWTGIFSYLLLGERWSLARVMGAVAILAGVTLVRSGHLLPHKPRKSTPLQHGEDVS